MFDGCEEWSISFTIFDIRVKFQILYHVFDDFNISSCNSIMQCNFTFGLFELIKHLLKWNVFWIYSRLFVEYLFFEINKVKFQLTNFKCCNWINYVFKGSRYLMILFKVLTVHDEFYDKILSTIILFIYKKVFDF
jgi:flagellar biosynthesis protein FlhB